MGKRLHFLGIIGFATALLAVKGAGNGNGLQAFELSHFEETQLAQISAAPPAQLLEMNILSEQGMGVDASTTLLQTVQNTYLVPRSSVLTTLFDEDERTEITKYEVQEGDVLGGIASDFGISLQTIISANNIVNVDALKPGTILTIPLISGIVHTVKKGDSVASLAKKYNADQEKIISYNALPLAGDLQIGDEIIVPGGTITSTVATRVITGNRRFAGLPVFEGFFKTPASCRITQKGHGRNGIDCAGKTGSSVFAAASGQVEISDATGFNGGYGKYVKIKHANGTATLYAHLSKVSVVQGETISQGQLVGLIGSTGRSSGPHLHLECHGCQNPLAGYKLGSQVIAKQ